MDLKVTEREANIIMTALMQMPYGQVAALVENLKNQIAEQIPKK